MRQTFIVTGRLPGYNQLKGRNWQESMRIKAEAMDAVMWAAKAQRIHPVHKKALIRIACTEPDKRRDEDNVLFGAAKIVLDALQRAGILANDNRRSVTLRLDPVITDKNPSVCVDIEEVE